MRRIRIIVYDGPDKWIETTKAHEYYKPGTYAVGSDRSITSIEATVSDIMGGVLPPVPEEVAE